ncbi:MAG: cache domain-containing protein [Candidatus Thiodiazotropha sp. 6PLUC4]
MTDLDNRKLLNLIRYAPVAVVFVFALAVNIIAIQDKRAQAALSIENLREELIFQQKEMIRSEVSQAYKQVILKKYQLESDLKERAKQRVYEAYGIANYVYARNIGKSRAEIEKLIRESLRPIRFFDGRGYYFILDMNGNTIMNAGNPEMEGKINWESRDEKGNYIFNGMLDIAEEHREGAFHWLFKKPGGPAEKKFDKVGYVKRFEPFDLLIGTGEYLSDFEESVKEDLLDWFSEYEYGEGGYFFVLDKNGILLAHHRHDFLGLNINTGTPLQENYFNNIMQQVRNGGGYVDYSKPLTLSGTVKLKQINYVKKIKGWDWIIGTGFSAQSFERRLKIKEEALIRANQQSLTNLIYLTIASMLLLTGSSLYVGNLIARRFEVFQKKIREDFDELDETKNKMEYMALHDDLTNLPNRVHMLKNIQKHIELSQTDNKILAVMFVDLDNFKNINDIYGHQVGDQLLGVVSRKFELLTGCSESVSRFGGDEFMFCYPNLNDTEDAKDKASLIHETLSGPIDIDGRTLTIGCSIGVSIYPDNSTDAEGLINQAYTVLYKSKSQRKGQSLFYSSSITEQIKRRAVIEHELALATKDNGFTVFYQPQSSFHNKNILSVEALARWNHPALGIISPTEFIAIAEEAGLINELGILIFRRACEDIYELSPNGKDALKLSVNISPVQLMDPELGHSLLEICAEIGIDPKRITLEVTENICIQDLDAVRLLLTQLREQGFGLSLDDFGTGYSSLNYITSLPLTELKIDRCFINRFIGNHQSDMLVRMIIGTGRLCGLVVVAEGVETSSQFKKLLNYECDICQGYYLDKPLNIGQLSKRIVKSKPVNNTDTTLPGSQ